MITDFPELAECERDLEFIGMDMLWTIRVCAAFEEIHVGEGKLEEGGGPRYFCRRNTGIGREEIPVGRYVLPFTDNYSVHPE